MRKEPSKNQTYYDVLRISPAATDAQVRKAYLKLASIYHPDKNPNNDQADAKFRHINEAYTNLKTANARARYNRIMLAKTTQKNSAKNDNSAIKSDGIWHNFLGLFGTPKEEKR